MIKKVFSLSDKKKKPGYIVPHSLKELWFHTGTLCNLHCAFCFEDSRPGDTRLEKISFDDVKPFIDEGTTLGVERISFTGGEPFVAKDLFSILMYALEYCPCLVLSNGTDPLLKNLSYLKQMLVKPHKLSFRISIDYPEEIAHDNGRGPGNFNKAVCSLKELYQMGFKVSVARHHNKDEISGSVNKQYQTLFDSIGLPSDTPVIAFPDLLKPGARPESTMISEDCMTRYHSEESRQEFMCAFSKMVIKQDGEMKVYACTLVDDDIAYDLGRNLKESMGAKVLLQHHRCMGCFAQGVSCSEG
ncbi:MAG: radical SAM protein [Fibrobacteria bacterium]|nr:radical SAM protein [Fibrobacteria bacterium]